jgi:NAD(P)-dependent dehydrogenase (short-subunit alcohol dehydrogenase family)
MGADGGRFANRTAIVTGAASGIGRATSVRLAHEGARVIATDITVASLESLAKELADHDIVTVEGDITSAGTVAAIVEACEGTADHLVNNAGIMDKFLPVGEMDDETWDKVLAVNLTAPMRLTRAVLPMMLKQGAGTIVNVGSVASLRSASGAAYAASKHALNGLTKSTSFYYAPQGVRCNAVLPGGVETNIDAPFGSEFAAARVGPILGATLPGMAQPEQIAAAITWLLSDDSSNVTGALLSSDGGWSAI